MVNAKTLISTVVIILTTQANSAALTVSEYFMLYQQNKPIAAAYTAGVVDASKGAFWCHKQDPKLELVMQAAIKNIVKNSIDPDKPADYAIVPPLMEIAPCKETKGNI